MRRCPAYPRVIEYQGVPRILVGSTEHYGAVLNGDFDYVQYLDELARHGLNQCRIFSGTYRDAPRTFQIPGNTLAPREAAFLCPWERLPGTEDHTPRIVDGVFQPVPLWDMTRWDERYWARLRDFCQAASDRGILVEYVLFGLFFTRDAFLLSPLCFYNQKNSPISPDRTIGGMGNNLFSIRTYGDTADGWRNETLPLMEALIVKACHELKCYDNVYFEICNAPFWEFNRYNDQMEAWQSWAVATVHRHAPQRLIAINVQEKRAVVEAVPTDVDILNFHYALPEAALINYHLGVVLADDETGYAGPDPKPYRQEAWRFLLSGGAIVSNLDLSFTIESPDGSATIAEDAASSGGKELRAQLGFLRRFAEAYRFWELRPSVELVRVGDASVLADPRRERVIAYLPEGKPITLGLGCAVYTLTWVDPVQRRAVAGSTLHAGSWVDLAPPEGLEEAVLILEARGDSF